MYCRDSIQKIFIALHIIYNEQINKRRAGHGVIMGEHTHITYISI